MEKLFKMQSPTINAEPPQSALNHVPKCHTDTFFKFTEVQIPLLP